jgi:DNA modification methylase
MTTRAKDEAPLKEPYGVSYAAKNEFLNRSDRGNRTQKPITNDHLTQAEIEALFRDALAAVVEHCEPGAACYATVPGGPLQVCFIRAFERAGFTFKHGLVWVKNQFVIGMSGYHFRHEPVLYGWLGNGPHYWCGDRSQDSVFEIDKPHVSDLHPTQKPVELIANSSRAGEIIYDPFSGAGTTLVATHQLGRATAWRFRLSTRRLRFRGLRNGSGRFWYITSGLVA